MAMNALQLALVNAGLAEPIKEKKNKHGKQFKCHRCKSPMIKFEGTNVMTCSNCGNYFIFREVM